MILDDFFPMAALAEAFNSTFPINWIDRSNEDLGLFHAEFQVGEGMFVIQYQHKYYNPGIWELSFTRNNELAMTGTGNASKILATVIAATREFIEAKDPRSLTFAASVDEPSRDKLYPKLARGIAKDFPDYVGAAKSGRKYTSYTYTRPSRPFKMPEPVPTKYADEPMTPRMSAFLDTIGDDELLAALREHQSLNRAMV